jgi:DNA-binding winged helix-turn-helix (wHTH) protein/Tfp pilus assembly protein PilF
MPDPSYSPKLSGAVYRIGGWTLCTRTNRLRRGDIEIELESRLVCLLVAFIDHPGEPLSKDWLLQTVWRGKTVTDESLLVAISQVRKALGDDTRAPSYIKTIPSKGYQLVAAVGPVEAPPVPTMRRGAAVSLTAAGLVCAVLAVVAFIARPPDAVLDAAGKKIAAGDPASLKAAIQDLYVLAERTPSAGAFASLAEAKMRLMGDTVAEPDNCREITGLLGGAIAFDASHARAYRLRAEARFLCRHDVVGAEADYRTALRLAPTDDSAALGYSGLLLAERRFAESRAQIEVARQVNPLTYSAPTVVWLYQMQGQNDLAYRELRRMEGAGSGGRWFHISALRVHTKAGRDAEAFSHLERLMQEKGYTAADIAAARKALQDGGMKAVFGWLLARKDKADLGHYTPPLSWARYALGAGERDQAMAHLEQAFARHQIPLLWAGVDPAYDPVRDDPRFKDWLAAIRTPLP